MMTIIIAKIMMWLGDAIAINNSRQGGNREFLPIAWHPLRLWERYMPEGE